MAEQTWKPPLDVTASNSVSNKNKIGRYILFCKFQNIFANQIKNQNLISSLTLVKIPLEFTLQITKEYQLQTTLNKTRNPISIQPQYSINVEYQSLSQKLRYI